MEGLGQPVYLRKPTVHWPSVWPTDQATSLPLGWRPNSWEINWYSLFDIPNNLITYPMAIGQPTNLLTYPHDCPTNWLSNQPIDLSPYWPTFPITKWPIIQLNDLPSPWLTNQIKFSFLHHRPTYLFPKYFLRCLTANLLIHSGF